MEDEKHAPVAFIASVFDFVVREHDFIAIRCGALHLNMKFSFIIPAQQIVWAPRGDGFDGEAFVFEILRCGRHCMIFNHFSFLWRASESLPLRSSKRCFIGGGNFFLGVRLSLGKEVSPLIVINEISGVLHPFEILWFAIWINTESR